MLEEIVDATKSMATELDVIGLMNVQYAVKDQRLYVLEVNPRASRTIPFVSKATGVPLAKMATKVMLGRSLKDLGLAQEVIPCYVSVKEAVLPFDRFPGVDVLLGPEMKSTGEVMGIDDEFGSAYAKAQIAAGQHLPVDGTVFISVNDRDKEAALPVAAGFQDLGFRILATRGTAKFLNDNSMEAREVHKVSLGRPHVVDAIKNREIQLVINTASGSETRRDGYEIRRAALQYRLPYTTTISGAMAISRAIASLKKTRLDFRSIQEFLRL
jgi:carbamoyl-phosphate synthase large subunit